MHISTASKDMLYHNPKNSMCSNIPFNKAGEYLMLGRKITILIV